MISGINTDVNRDGVIYHVQTEDLGAKNPIILTLVYKDGAVVLRDKLLYGQILARDPSISLTKALMDAQHRRIVRHVASGTIVAVVPPGEPTSTRPSKTVDELIEEYLCSRRRGKANTAPPPTQHTSSCHG